MTDIPVSENFQPVPGVKYDDEGQQPQEPAKDPTPATPAPETPEQPAEAKPEEPKAPEPKVEEPKAEEPQRDPEGRFKPKPKPIAKLLEQKHELETQLESERKAKADLETKLAELSQRPASPQADASIKSLAEKHGIGEDVLADIVAAARAGIKVPELPKEVSDLIAERKQQQEQQAELDGFKNDVARLQKTFKDEAFLADPKVQEKLLELAYSTDKAPDGEPYYHKPLHELYFNHIKPQIEPGRKTAEPSRGGSAQGSPVLDYAELAADSVAMDKFAREASPEEWAKFSAWEAAHQKGSPLRRV